MVNVNKLRGLFAEHNLSQVDVAKILGMTSKTLYTRMRKGDFSIPEADILIKTLNIKDPCEIFFN